MPIDLTARIEAIEAGLANAVPLIKAVSLPQTTITLTAAAGDKAMNNIVVVGIPAGATVNRAILIFWSRIIANTNAAANKLNGVQEIQIRINGAGAWTDAINFNDDMFSIAASTREGGTVFKGVNVAAVVNADGTYNIQWDEGVADFANLVFEEVQTELDIWYSV